jgi:hypothetical protein
MRRYRPIHATVRSTIQLRTHKLERLPATFEDAKLIDGKRWLSLQVQRKRLTNYAADDVGIVAVS